jgi:replication factor A1
LTTFNNKFTIKCRVLQKGDVKTFIRSFGEGKLFNVVLTDADGDKIQATFYNAAVDKCLDLI